MNRTAILSIALLAAACTEEAADPSQQGGEAAGEVLGGDISDAMIPLDQIESQAPLAPRAALAAPDVDAEQPDVVPAAGIEGARPGEGAAAAPAAPAGQPDE